ncbi:MAG: 16S rRNA (cytidine(1402)-2'-O)-methyltransferase [Armatimonadota bacterium]|nr:16S rRNA (cytidine(1402)-2'-O)-methyltransferase [Armatimonadota bacterium]
MAGKLYIVATPIGNLEDITLRAIRVLKEADLIAAEDTRVTRKLLSRYDIHTPVTPYHQHSKGGKSRQIAERIESGENVALVSDAGTPGISDPGHELIANAIERGIDIVFAPGANAIIMALVVSGLPTNHFAFDGFPPRKESERRSFFHSLRRESRTLAFYESPLRLLATLKSMQAEFGDRRIAVLREATKLFEEVFRGTISEAIERFTARKPRGELTIVVEGSSETAADETETDPKDMLRSLISEGLSERDAVKQVAAELKMPHRQVYALMLRLKEEARDD